MVPFRHDEFSKRLGHLYSVLGDIEEMGIGEAPKVIAHIPNLMDNRRKQEQEELESISGELVEDLGEEHACVGDPSLIALNSFVQVA